MRRPDLPDTLFNSVRLLRILPLAVASIVTLSAVSAWADDKPPGAAALARARGAWERGEADIAEASYREAIEQGGLAPDEVREGYIRLGAARAVLGRKDQSINAFRAAAVLDSEFAVPAEAGKKAAQYAAQAKKDVAKIGALSFAAQFPDKVESQTPFKVKVQLDAAHVGVVKGIVITAKDGSGGKDYSKREAPKETLELEVPSSIAIAGSTVAVRVDAIDGRNNRLASADGRVQVIGEAAPAAALAEVPKKADTPPPKRGGGSIWSSPWPYVVGGLVLVGTGAAVYFQTRPTETVTLGQPGVDAK